MKSLKPRLLTAAIGIPCIVLVIFLSELWHPTLTIVVTAVTAIMVGEYLYAKGLMKPLPLSVTCIAAAVAMTALSRTAFIFAALFVFLSAAFLVLILLHKRINYADLCYAVLGTLLISFGMSAVIIACDNAISLTFCFFLVFMVPWMADTGGFFVGAGLGKHKLCPDISPKKTVEGAIGGILFCMITAVGLGLVFQLWIIPDASVNFFSLVIIGALDAVFSIIGDLSFSLIKRHFGVKDYGTVFPGHGGFLDRCDSIIFTAPIVVILGQFMPLLSVG